MKQLLNSVSNILGLFIFGILIAVFVFTLQQGLDNSQSSVQSAYPDPGATELKIALQNPYPEPPNPPSAQISCVGIGEWLTYTDWTAGYSLKYPSESRFRETPNDTSGFKTISISLRPECHTQTPCSGSNKVVVSIFNNPQHLALEEFVDQAFKLQSSPPLNDSFSHLQEGGTFITVAEVEALYIEEGITLAKPDIFIPHNDRVIWVYVSSISPIPPHDPPCNTTLALLDEILASIKLFLPQ